MTLSYFASDELPHWVATISHNGALPDFSSGWTFRVVISTAAGGTPLLEKTTNITGAASGVVTVAWASGDLAITPGSYRIQLKATRTADNAEATIEDSVTIKRRY